MELMRANREWSTRPADERFTSLIEMRDFTRMAMEMSADARVDLRTLKSITDDNGNLMLVGPKGNAAHMTNHAFGQLTKRIGAPPQFLSNDLSPELASEVVNYRISKLEDDDAKASMLMQKYSNGDIASTCVLSPNYTRIRNYSILDELVNRFGDGITGDFTVPGIFGTKLKTVTKDNTTFFASDRDMFVFLADETHKVTINNRRDGKSGELSRGFFVWNSEVGSATFGIAWFLFDYVCSNRIVWGANDYKEITFRHTKNAQERFFDDFIGVIKSYSNQPASGLEHLIANAQSMKIGDSDDVTKFLVNKGGFNTKTAKLISKAHETEELRPIETVWDVSTGITAYAKTRQNNNDRVELERIGGKILDLAA